MKLHTDNNGSVIQDDDGNELIKIIFDMNAENDATIIQMGLDLLIRQESFLFMPKDKFSPLPWTLMNASYRDCNQHVIDANLGRPFYFVTKETSPTKAEEELMNEIIDCINQEMM